MERRFHDIEMRFMDERRKIEADYLQDMRRHFIDHYPNHPDLAKVLDIYDTEISVAQHFVFESFEYFMVRIPDITQWSCYKHMTSYVYKHERTVLTY